MNFIIIIFFKKIKMGMGIAKLSSLLLSQSRYYLKLSGAHIVDSFCDIEYDYSKILMWLPDWWWRAENAGEERWTPWLIFFFIFIQKKEKRKLKEWSINKKLVVKTDKSGKQKKRIEYMNWIELDWMGGSRSFLFFCANSKPRAL